MISDEAKWGKGGMGEWEKELGIFAHKSKEGH
jgi:hypothetical protein